MSLTHSFPVETHKPGGKKEQQSTTTTNSMLNYDGSNIWWLEIEITYISKSKAFDQYLETKLSVELYTDIFKMSPLIWKL